LQNIEKRAITYTKTARGKRGGVGAKIAGMEIVWANENAA